MTKVQPCEALQATKKGKKSTISGPNIANDTEKNTHKRNQPSILGIIMAISIAATSFAAGTLCPAVLASYMVHVASPSKLVDLFNLEHLSPYIKSVVNPIERRVKALVHGQGGCSQYNLDMFLHDQPVSGLHIACLAPEENILNVTLYHRATKSRMSTHTVSHKWASLKDLLKSELDLTFHNHFTDKKREKWAIFTPNGRKIADDHGNGPKISKMYLDNILDSKMIIIFTGGAWIWPGVREGFERHITLSSVFPTTQIETLTTASYRLNSTAATKMSTTRALLENGMEDVVTLKTLSLLPLVLSVDHFLTEQECTHIIERATPHMTYSGVSLKDSDKGKPASNWRTSKTSFLSARDDQILIQVGVRVASLTRLPVSHQEQVQVLRYGLTEKYDAHNDFFDPFHYQQSPDVLKTIDNGEKNRLATVFWYLSDVERGGETIFPRHGGKSVPSSFASCEVGLKVTPRKGRVIIFYSMLPDGQTDDYSLHGACPVKEGVKWAANKWVWNQPSGYGI